MTRLTRIGVRSLAIFQAALFGLIGLLCGVLYSFGGLILDALVSLGWITSSETPGLSFGTVLAFGALVGMPLIFAVSGFVAGLVEGWALNLVARWVGGIQVELEA